MGGAVGGLWGDYGGMGLVKGLITPEDVKQTPLTASTSPVIVSSTDAQSSSELNLREGGKSCHLEVFFFFFLKFLRNQAATCFCLFFLFLSKWQQLWSCSVSTCDAHRWHHVSGYL